MKIQNRSHEHSFINKLDLVVKANPVKWPGINTGMSWCETSAYDIQTNL